MQAEAAGLHLIVRASAHLIRTAFDKVDYILKARGTELVMTKKVERAA